MGVVHFRFSVQGDFTDKMAGAPSLILWVRRQSPSSSSFLLSPTHPPTHFFPQDIALDVDARRKGLGKHCLMLLELIARKQAMHALCVPVSSPTHPPTHPPMSIPSASFFSIHPPTSPPQQIQLTDESAQAWVTKGGKGYAPMDEDMKETIGFEAEEEGFEVYVKTLLVVPPAAAVKKEEEENKEEQVPKEN